MRNFTGLTPDLLFVVDDQGNPVPKESIYTSYYTGEMLVATDPPLEDGERVMRSQAVGGHPIDVQIYPAT